MGFDWFILFAQGINFLILVVLLKRVLFDRIVGAMDEREQQMKKRVSAAEEARTNAEAEKERYREKLDALTQQESVLLSEAKDKAARQEREMLEAAERDVSEKRRRWQEGLLYEKEAFLRSVRQRTIHHVYLIANSALSDLAGQSLQERMAEMLVQRLSQLSDEEKAKFAAGAQEGKDNGIQVRSAFELDDELRRKIEESLRANTPLRGLVHFEHDENLLGGFEILSGGYHLSWNLNQYLDELEREVSRELEGQTGEASQRTHESIRQEAG